MKFISTPLRDAYVIEPEPFSDDRGFFARIWCRREFEALGLESTFAQRNLSFNKRKGTIRGMHLQRPPHQEAKLLRCTRGSIQSVIIDLRPESDTYMRWHGVELSEDNRKQIYVPKGFANGYQALTDEAEASYAASAFYSPGSELGVRFDDPAFGIEWPLEPVCVSEKDRSWPNFKPESVDRSSYVSFERIF